MEPAKNMKVPEEQYGVARTKSRRTLLAELSEALKIVAPGTELRRGIDNIIRAGNGGLVVVGDPGSLGTSLISGGFELECGFTAVRLYELAKTDGAVVISPDMSRVHYANAQLSPDANLPSTETGMRHLAAHRTAQQTGALAIAYWPGYSGTNGRNSPRTCTCVPADRDSWPAFHGCRSGSQSGWSTSSVP